jgi:hypothetical protein
MVQGKAERGVRNVVLVHGGFVDGSGWQGVYDTLKQERLHGVRRPEPDDLAGRRRGGHPAHTRGTRWSGGARRPLVRGRGHHRAGNDPKVAALVYIAAFAPDRGESVSALIQNPPPGAPVPPILPPQD